VECWNGTEKVRDYMGAQGYPLTQEGYYDLWDEFTKKEMAMLERLDRTPITWDDAMAAGISLPSSTIVQVWQTSAYHDVENPIYEALQKGLRVIVSNSDAWYLDCGHGNWLFGQESWCDPFKEWQTMWENEPFDLAEPTVSQREAHHSDGIFKDAFHFAETKSDLILGGEAAMWAEQTDEYTLDSTVWPRTSAVAERLWSNPMDLIDWFDAIGRIRAQRERMVSRGIYAHALQPKYCTLNPGECPRASTQETPSPEMPPKNVAMSAGEIVGIAVGSVAGIAIVSGLAFGMFSRRAGSTAGEGSQKLIDGI